MNAPLASGHLANIEALISARRFGEAESTCEAILSRQPRDPGARYYRAMLRIHAGRHADASALLESLVKDEPSFVAARYLLADALRHSGQFGKAAERYAEEISRSLGLGGADLGSRIEAIVDCIARAPVAQWKGRAPALQALGFSLDKSGFDIAASGLDRRLAESPLPLVADETALMRMQAACALLAVGQGSSPQWMRRIVHGVLLPWMRRALAGGVHSIALELESLIYITYVVTTENQDHFRESFGLWVDDMREGGRTFAATLPPVQRASSGPVPRIAFFVHNVTMLAHTTALLEVLEGHAELPEPRMKPYLFHEAGDPAAIDRFRRAGLQVEALPGSAASRLAHLRRRIAEEGIDVLAWISLAITMPFAFGMRLAPRQVWWAMKYHALEFAEIDDYVTGGGETGIHRIQGRPWRVGPVVAAKWFAPELTAEARRIREGLGARGLVFGSFGRTEKLDSPVFLDAVIEILRKNPDAVFLWTGRSPHAGIQARFEEAGVAARCRFIGWVDTKLYAQVIDVFLDSFPFPGGFTLYEAMAASKPAVLFASPESAHGGINAIVGHLLESHPASSDEARLAQAIFRPEAGVSLYLRAKSVAEYVDHACELARDGAWRERVGVAGSQFILKLMTDRRRAANIYVDHLLGLPA